MLVTLTVGELHKLVADVVTEFVEDMRPSANALLDTAGCAQLLAVSTATVRRLRGEGMPHVRVGDAARYERGAVLEWLRQRARTEVEP